MVADDGQGVLERCEGGRDGGVAVDGDFIACQGRCPTGERPAGIGRGAQGDIFAIVIGKFVGFLRHRAVVADDGQGISSGVKVAVTVLLALMVMAAGLVLPERSPLQLLKVQPAAGVAVSVTTSP